ncbi:hypothetical protein BDV26DRAFT_292475 [Aspergillus bertholletiae]|uniref:Transcription factor domain-containing protein n=1 Tax=Aspergillus bertholletiae TaxID=1226010 RepID=A0A5N7B8R1_9EURO|nr:hypothetical protein BDV26DRAFT_292475 [Aspergillus bertholletiae]
MYPELCKLAIGNSKWDSQRPREPSAYATLSIGTVPCVSNSPHRLLIAESRPHNTGPSVAVNSFRTCATAGKAFICLLQIYDETPTRRASYLIYYATYAAGTILLRIAAQWERDSQAYASLRICLSMFSENPEMKLSARSRGPTAVADQDPLGHLDSAHTVNPRNNVPQLQPWRRSQIGAYSSADLDTATFDMDMIIT